MHSIMPRPVQMAMVSPASWAARSAAMFASLTSSLRPSRVPSRSIASRSYFVPEADAFDGDEVPEPEDGAAPTTDAPGESPKLEHDDRG